MSTQFWVPAGSLFLLTIAVFFSTLLETSHFFGECSTCLPFRLRPCPSFGPQTKWTAIGKWGPEKTVKNRLHFPNRASVMSALETILQGLRDLKSISDEKTEHPLVTICFLGSATNKVGPYCENRQKMTTFCHDKASLKNHHHRLGRGGQNHNHRRGGATKVLEVIKFHYAY